MNSTFYAKDHIQNLEDTGRILRNILLATTRPEDKAVVEARITTVDNVTALLQGYSDIERLHYRLGQILSDASKRGDTFSLSNAELFKLLVGVE